MYFTPLCSQTISLRICSRKHIPSMDHSIALYVVTSFCPSLLFSYIYIYIYVCVCVYTLPSLRVITFVSSYTQSTQLCPCVKLYCRKSLMSLCLLHLQCPICFVHLTCMVSKMGSKWLYSNYFRDATTSICGKQLVAFWCSFHIVTTNNNNNKKKKNQEKKKEEDAPELKLGWIHQNDDSKISLKRTKKD